MQLRLSLHLFLCQVQMGQGLLQTQKRLLGIGPHGGAGIGQSRLFPTPFCPVLLSPQEVEIRCQGRSREGEGDQAHVVHPDPSRSSQDRWLNRRLPHAIRYYHQPNQPMPTSLLRQRQTSLRNQLLAHVVQHTEGFHLSTFDADGAHRSGKQVCFTRLDPYRLLPANGRVRRKRRGPATAPPMCRHPRIYARRPTWQRLPVIIIQRRFETPIQEAILLPLRRGGSGKPGIGHLSQPLGRRRVFRRHLKGLLVSREGIFPPVLLLVESRLLPPAYRRQPLTWQPPGHLALQSLQRPRHLLRPCFVPQQEPQTPQLHPRIHSLLRPLPGRLTVELCHARFISQVKPIGHIEMQTGLPGQRLKGERLLQEGDDCGADFLIVRTEQQDRLISG